jgi:hypothetical protein
MSERIPSSNRVVINIIQVVFGCGRKEVTELKVMETAAGFEICVFEFIEMVDSGGIVCGVNGFGLGRWFYD